MLGADIRIIAPKQFPLLNRVIKKADNLGPDSDNSIDHTYEFKGSFDGLDAVFAMNWCCLEQFNHPDRNAEIASALRHWFFTNDTLPARCRFTTQPPAQTDLLADKNLLDSNRNLSQQWWRSRIAVLGSTIKWVLQNNDSQHPIALI